VECQMSHVECPIHLSNDPTTQLPNDPIVPFTLMNDFLNKTFHLSESNTTIRTEVLAGLTTFMTMSYIIFVQPAVLSTTGMDFQAVLAATCVISAIGCFLMAFLANYPIAVAPAMGH